MHWALRVVAAPSQLEVSEIVAKPNTPLREALAVGALGSLTTDNPYTIDVSCRRAICIDK